MEPSPTPPDHIRDAFGRPLGSLRLSVTDRCNLRCRYCMPEEHYVWLPRASILDYEEAARLAGVFASLGVTRVRLTGGEPLLRRDLPQLVRLLRRVPRLTDLAATTNGVLLVDLARPLREAGLGRVTVSLDTLRPDRYREMSGRDRLPDALGGIRAARDAGFTGIKVNTVVVRNVNDDELEDLLAFGRAENVEVRFIEYMDVGGATRWSSDGVVPRREMLERIGRAFGRPEPVTDRTATSAPADRFRLADGTTFGIIASTTAPFCGTCDRSRLTADGMWYRCLYADVGTDLKTPLRDGATDETLAVIIRDAWRQRADRGAEERLAAAERGPLFPLEGLRRDPHREMHTRGG